MTPRDRHVRMRSFAAALFAAIVSAASARAGTEIYGINLDGIYRLDPSTSVSTTIYTGAPFPFASTAVGPAALAQCANGNLWFTDRTNNPATLYRFNPATPAVAPVAVGTTTGTADTLIRMSCHPTTGVLYGMASAWNTLYTLNQSTGAATGTALTPPATTLPINGSGDIAFDSFGTLYYVGESDTGTGAGSVRLWTINLGTSTFINVGALSGLPNVVNGIAFTAGGALRLTPTNSTQMYTAPITGGATSGVGAAGAMPAMTDLSSVPVPDPDLSITKTANVQGILPSTATPVTYTITATNNSSYAVTGTVTDTFPAGLSSISWTCAASGGSTCGAASGAGNIATTAQLAPAGTATYTVTVTANSATAITNTATVALSFAYMVDATPANNTASNTLYLRPTVTESFGATTVPVGGTSQLTLTLGNANASALTLSAVFTHALPTGLVVATPNGLGGTCPAGSVTAAAGTNTITYASGASIAAGGCTILVNVQNNASTAAAIANGAGTYIDTVAAGALATNGGTNAAGATANLAVIGGYKSVRLQTDADSSGSVTPGDTLQWSVFFFNPPNGASAGITVPAFQATDTIGAHMTYVPGSLSLTQTPGGCDSGSANASFNGAGNPNLFTAGANFTAPANSGCTVRFDYRVTITAGVGGWTLSNQASGSGTGLAAVATDNIDSTTSGQPSNVAPTAVSIAQTQLSASIDPTTVTVGSEASLTVAKSSIAFSDPYNNTTNPKRIPGGFVTYSVVTTNGGAGTVDNNTTVLVDPIPANTALFVNDVGGAGSGPVAFTNGSPSSGLSYTFTSLASPTDDLSFSNDGGATFTYTPVPDANGVDANVTHIRINPKGIFAGNAGPPSPNWTVSFRVRIK
jgi:trimeric autotransporter adhesin